MRLSSAYLTAFVFLCAPANAAPDNGAPAAEAFAHLTNEDYAAAHALAAPLAESGDADAQHLMGYLFENGLDVERSMVRALEFYQAAARQGHTDAQFTLAELAFTGDGVQQDYASAASWYRLASLRGHPRAKLRLGVLYAEGSGVEKNKARARDLFEQAASAGEPEGNYNIGVAYLTGDGVRRNDITAAEAFESAATEGHLLAQYNLALLLQSGRLGAPDDATARRWMLAAANGGLPAAMVGMGLMTHATRDVAALQPGEKSASDWFERAALAGDAQGQFLFAVSLAKGDGRAVDTDEALRWLGFALEESSGLEPDMRRDAEGLRAELLRQ